jgi:hypothetical protein
MTSLLLPPFTVLTSSITAAAFPIMHHCCQTLLPAIATLCRNHQTTSLPPPPFAISITMPIERLQTPAP